MTPKVREILLDTFWIWAFQLNYIVVNIYTLKVLNTTKYVFNLNSWYLSYVNFIEKKMNFTVCVINDVVHHFSTLLCLCFTFSILLPISLQGSQFENSPSAACLSGNFWFLPREPCVDYTLGSVAEARWNENLCRFSARSLPDPVLPYCQLAAIL